jgi:hypothetical protein
MPRRRAVEDVSRLPLWAQRRLAALEQNLLAAREEALAATTPGASNTTVHDYVDIGSFRGLPPFSRIRFGTEEEWIEAFVKKEERTWVAAGDAKPPKEGLVVELYSGTGNLIVRPCVANVVYVKQERR